MPVNTEHPTYTAMKPVWAMMRATAGGQRAMHAAGETYLPKLKGENAKDFAARMARAAFFNATWRTIAGLAGMLMRKDPTVKVSALVEPMLEDVTQTGISLVTLAGQLAEEGLTVGRVGLMVDYPTAAIDGARTVAEVEALNLRPKLAMYKCESAINWATTWILNKSRLSMVVLAESASLPGKDEWTPTVEPRWRVLDLVPYTPADAAPGTPPGLAYRVRVFKMEQKAEVLVEGPLFPLMDGKPLDYIPFTFLGVDNTTPNVDEPPLVDLAYVNVSHYQSTADVEHGAHKTSLPQPWASGLSSGGGPGDADNPMGKKAPTFYMGGGEIWLHPDPAGKFGMLEYTGQGLEAIETRLVRKEAHMAVLGARMLEDQKKAVETAEVAGMHRSGEHSTLANQGKTISSGVRQALEWFDLWAGGPGVVEFALNDEFLPAALTSTDITALVGAWQSGGLSDEELFNKFQKGGVVRETTTFEQHQTQIENSAPKLMQGNPDPADPTNKGAKP